MRLINTATFELEEFADHELPAYTILSHTWREGEVTYQDWQDINHRSKKPGWEKIRHTCEQAQHDGPRYAWIDTCCINKESSAELSEAINSMYVWYQNAALCYAYLDDVDHKDGLEKLGYARWFSRGWTLQELIVPEDVHFFDSQWELVGQKSHLSQELATITGIEARFLRRDGQNLLHLASVAQKMSWAAARQTSRVEDRAYCLLGLFDVNMPLLYGEGEKAFTRLQEEIIRTTGDQTILSWMIPEGDSSIYSIWNGCFAPDASAFSHGQELYSAWSSDLSLSSVGLRISLPLISVGNGALKLGALSVYSTSKELDVLRSTLQMCLLLVPHRLGTRTDVFVCSKWCGKPIYLPASWFESTSPQTIYLHHARSRRTIAYKQSKSITRRRPNFHGHAIMPVFGLERSKWFTPTRFRSVRWAGAGSDNMTLRLEHVIDRDFHIGKLNMHYQRERPFRADKIIDLTMEIKVWIKPGPHWPAEITILEDESTVLGMLPTIVPATGQFEEVATAGGVRIVRLMLLEMDRIEGVLTA